MSPLLHPLSLSLFLSLSLSFSLSVSLLACPGARTSVSVRPVE
jgi:hypothetical protein